MLAAQKRNAIRTSAPKRAATGTLHGVAAGCKKAKSVARSQTILAIARHCRDCGHALSALEGTLHRCAESLEWRGSEAFASLATMASGCRIARLPVSAANSSTARARLEAVWEFIQHDLSHAFHLPSAEALTSGASAILLALRGRQVLGLLWAERITSAVLSSRTERRNCCDDGAPTASCQAAQVRASIGVALVWVRRTERRRGVATALINAARATLAGAGSTPVPVNEVAFSQTTRMGSDLAERYLGEVHQGDIPLYEPAW